MRPTLSIITITFNDPIGFRRTAASVKDHLSSVLSGLSKTEPLNVVLLMKLLN